MWVVHDEPWRKLEQTLERLEVHIGDMLGHNEILCERRNQTRELLLDGLEVGNRNDSPEGIELLSTLVLLPLGTTRA